MKKLKKKPRRRTSSVRGKKVICAMSGGVDSSVAAAILKRAGVDELRSSSRTSSLERVRKNFNSFDFATARVFDVVGVFMKFWSEEFGGSKNRCCSLEAEKRARKVASVLKIPFYVLNFEKEFKQKIVDDFLKEYKKGNTPNPCVVCNKEIKFGLLLEKALALDGDFIATGHYVRKKKSGLKKGKDKTKDQSYFLWMLDRKQIERVLFPVGDYNKTEVKAMAKKFKLPVLGIPESQEICFIQTTVNDFLSRHLKVEPGNIVDIDGKILGKHKGLAFYTIGQRKGIRLSGGPYFVLDKNERKNVLIVTKKEKDLFKKELMIRDVNWISGKAPALPLKVKAKIRYRHEPSSARVCKKGSNYCVVFDKAQRAITPGQSVVFYKGQELLGGGIIK